MRRKAEEIRSSPSPYPWSQTWVPLHLTNGGLGGNGGGKVIGVEIPQRLIRQFNLDLRTNLIRKERENVVITGRSNGVAVEHRVLPTDLKLKSRQRKELGF